MKRRNLSFLKSKINQENREIIENANYKGIFVGGGGKLMIQNYISFNALS